MEAEKAAIQAELQTLKDRLSREQESNTDAAARIQVLLQTT